MTDQERCGYCGSLDWTVRKYGRVTHKEACPHRSEAWHQGAPGDSSRDALATLIARRIYEFAMHDRGRDELQDGWDALNEQQQAGWWLEAMPAVEAIHAAGYSLRVDTLNQLATQVEAERIDPGNDGSPAMMHQIGFNDALDAVLGLIRESVQA